MSHCSTWIKYSQLYLLCLFDFKECGNGHCMEHFPRFQSVLQFDFFFFFSVPLAFIVLYSIPQVSEGECFRNSYFCTCSWVGFLDGSQQGCFIIRNLPVSFCFSEFGILGDLTHNARIQHLTSHYSRKAYQSQFKPFSLGGEQPSWVSGFENASCRSLWPEARIHFTVNAWIHYLFSLCLCDRNWLCSPKMILWTDLRWKIPWNGDFSMIRLFLFMEVMAYTIYI